MKSRGVDDGHVINISSMAAHRIAPPVGAGAYAASKYALRALTEGKRPNVKKLLYIIIAVVLEHRLR